MRRIKNLVIGGIENKIFNLILAAVILITAAYLGVSVYYNNMLIHLAEESARKQQAAITELSETAMESVTEQSLNSTVERLQESYTEIQEEMTDAYEIGVVQAKNRMILLLLLVAAVLLAGTLVLGKRIVRPLNRIVRNISKLGEGNLEFKMEDAYRTGDEIEVLAESFASISHKTVQYLEQVKQVSAEKERIGTELRMATQIQDSMLPHMFPPFPDRKEFDIYASMDPAREVGGDFYDFFLIDDDHLCMVMADVSGKGVPAALYMMVSKVIIQSCAMLGKSAEDILKLTNEALCSNNQVEMFVTVWLGILEISTGKVQAANAGHEYPAICRKGGKFELLKDRHGFVVGGMEGMTYHGYEIRMHAGDTLFLYTDGVPEAANTKEELFGTDRMLEALNAAWSGTTEVSPREILKQVRSHVDSFVGTAEQFDDLTMMCVAYKGSEG